MNIKIPYSLLKEHLDTDATPEIISEKLSLSGPTVDHLDKIGDDWVLDTEIITNRVDSAGAFGIAREAAAILPQSQIKAELINDPYAVSLKDLSIPSQAKPPVKVSIEKATFAPRFACIALDHVTIKPSPSQTQTWLTLAGERPLNNVIDITNELTLRYGQPVHIFDLDKIRRQQMILRESRAGEKITTLDGKTHTLRGGDLVIEDGDGRLIDLCGIRGGDLSAVDQHTTRILLFVQTYDPHKIRKTSLYTQERTVAAQYMEKSPDPEMVLPVLIEGVKMLTDRAGAKISSTLVDIYPNPPQPKMLTLDLTWLNRFVGITIPTSQVIDILTRLGFTSKKISADQLDVTIPTWRLHDVSIKEDLAEEITRVYGYYRLPSHLPPTTIPSTSTALILHHESLARHYLADLGFTEMYNYALISEALSRQTGVSLQHAFRLANPLAIDYEYMRPSLLPSLLQNLAYNRGEISPPVLLFELANIYLPQKDGPLAQEQSTLAMVIQGKSFAEAKGFLGALSRRFNLQPAYSPVVKPPAPFDPAMTAVVSVDHTPVGHLGRLDPAVTRQFSLPDPVWTLELNFERLSSRATLIHHFKPVPAFPGIIEDLTVTLPPKTLVGPVIETIASASPLVESVNLKTTYGQNYTFTVTYRDPQKTLTDTEVKDVRHHIISQLEQSHHALLVGQAS